MNASEWWIHDILQTCFILFLQFSPLSHNKSLKFCLMLPPPIFVSRARIVILGKLTLLLFVGIDWYKCQVKIVVWIITISTLFISAIILILLSEGFVMLNSSKNKLPKICSFGLWSSPSHTTVPSHSFSKGAVIG